MGQSAEIPRIGQQLNIPGIDNEEKAPAKFDEAISWLRKHCKVVQAWNEDIDLLKITLEVDNPDGDKRKFYQEVEVFPGDLKSCAPVLIRQAQEAFAFKKMVSEGKRFEIVTQDDDE